VEAEAQAVAVKEQQVEKYVMKEAEEEAAEKAAAVMAARRRWQRRWWRLWRRRRRRLAFHRILDSSGRAQKPFAPSWTSGTRAPAPNARKEVGWLR